MSYNLISMAGPSGLDVDGISNFEAGVIVLAELDKAVPDITWRELFLLGDAVGDPEKMGRSLLGRIGAAINPMPVIRSVGHIVGEVTRETGHVAGQVGRATGDVVGGSVRLLTDESVVDGLARAWNAFKGGGGVLGAGGEGGAGGSGNPLDALIGFISSIGQKAKNENQASLFGLTPAAWGIGIGASLLLLLIFKPSRSNG